MWYVPVYLLKNMSHLFLWGPSWKTQSWCKDYFKLKTWNSTDTGTSYHWAFRKWLKSATSGKWGCHKNLSSSQGKSTPLKKKKNKPTINLLRKWEAHSHLWQAVCKLYLPCVLKIHVSFFQNFSVLPVRAFFLPSLFTTILDF